MLQVRDPTGLGLSCGFVLGYLLVQLAGTISLESMEVGAYLSEGDP